MADLAFHGIIGPDDSARRLVKRCEDLGIVFEGSQALAILELDRSPRFPGSPGRARQVGAEDEVAFGAFMRAFLREADPHEPAPPAGWIAADAQSGRYLFWTVDDVPVSMAGKVRETAILAAISGVYTLPERRGRGYAGSVTAALCERLFAERKHVLCLADETPISLCFAPRAVLVGPPGVHRRRLYQASLVLRPSVAFGFRSLTSDNLLRIKGHMKPVITPPINIPVMPVTKVFQSTTVLLRNIYATADL